MMIHFPHGAALLHLLVVCQRTFLIMQSTNSENDFFQLILKAGFGEKALL